MSSINQGILVSAYTRKDGTNVREHYRNLSPSELDRMEGITTLQSVKDFEESVQTIHKSMLNEGWEQEDVMKYLEFRTDVRNKPFFNSAIQRIEGLTDSYALDKFRSSSAQIRRDLMGDGFDISDTRRYFAFKINKLLKG